MFHGSGGWRRAAVDSTLRRWGSDDHRKLDSLGRVPGRVRGGGSVQLASASAGRVGRLSLRMPQPLPAVRQRFSSTRRLRQKQLRFIYLLIIHGSFFTVAEPSGWSSAEESDHVVVEGDSVNFTCSAQTAGSFKPRHVISHNHGGSIPHYDCSGGGQTGFSCWSVNEEIERGDESREFSCETLFDPNDLPEFPDGHATNAPDFSHILPLPQIEEVQCKYSPYM